MAEAVCLERLRFQALELGGCKLDDSVQGILACVFELFSLLLFCSRRASVRARISFTTAWVPQKMRDLAVGTGRRRSCRVHFQRELRFHRSVGERWRKSLEIRLVRLLILQSTRACMVRSGLRCWILGHTRLSFRPTRPASIRSLRPALSIWRKASSTGSWRRRSAAAIFPGLRLGTSSRQSTVATETPSSARYRVPVLSSPSPGRRIRRRPQYRSHRTCAARHRLVGCRGTAAQNAAYARTNDDLSPIWTF